MENMRQHFIDCPASRQLENDMDSILKVNFTHFD